MPAVRCTNVYRGKFDRIFIGCREFSKYIVLFGNVVLSQPRPSALFRFIIAFQALLCSDFRTGEFRVLDVGTHEDEKTVLYKTKTDDIVQTTQSTHTCANCM